MIYFTKLIKPENSKYVLSIAHKDYMSDIGGVEKLIKEHSEIFQNRNISYVYVCPLKFDSGIYKFYIDDQYIGAFDIKTLCRWMKSWNASLLQLQIHHILHWRTQDINYLIQSIDGSLLVYLHDYFYLCPHYNLINSENIFCGQGAASDFKCARCSFYKKSFETISYNRQILKLFYDKKAVFIAPSEFVRDLWIQSLPQFEEKTFVLEHLTLSGNYSIKKKCKEPYKIAYIGAQYDIKGWPIFEKLLQKLKDDNRYLFYHFGVDSKNNDRISNISVSFQRDGKDAMRNAILKESIDFTIFFPQWPETYNYTCYEAYLGGAYLCCSTVSGNIQNMVREYSCGIVFESFKELETFFEGEDAAKVLYAYREANNTIVPKYAEPNDGIINYVHLDKKANMATSSSLIAFENFAGILNKVKTRMKIIIRGIRR